MTKITAEQVKEIALSLPRDGSNPKVSRGFGGPVCVYTDPSDPSNHCIAGEILTRLGVTLPDVESNANWLGITDLAGSEGFDVNFEGDALNALDVLQRRADSGTHLKSELPWGDAIRKVYGK